MMAHNSDAVHRESEHDDESKGAVVDNRVEQHQRQSSETRAEARHQRRVAERRRDRLGRQRLQSYRQGTKFIASAKVFRRRLVNDPEISPWPSKLENADWLGWMIGAD